MWIIEIWRGFRPEQDLTSFLIDKDAIRQHRKNIHHWRISFEKGSFLIATKFDVPISKIWIFVNLCVCSTLEAVNILIIVIKIKF